jgi:LPXTG-site transpeptidase (sortase) family protein
MEDLRDTTARLAFQADRKILHAEEEDHLRMDIPAHERLRKFKHKRPSSAPTIKRFALTTAAIFLGLFFITNMSAYSQIIMANIKDYTAEQETMGPVVPDEDEVAIPLPEDGIFPLNITPTTYENQIRIPSIEVDSHFLEPELGIESLLSQDWNELENQIRSSLLQGIVHYPGTAEPGQKGNFFVTGHSSNVFWEVSPYNTIFALLPRIEVGADVFVTYEQNEYHYRVTETKEVGPNDVSILKQGSDSQMTLMTCTPVGTTLKRFVVTAELVD